MARTTGSQQQVPALWCVGWRQKVLKASTKGSQFSFLALLAGPATCATNTRRFETLGRKRETKRLQGVYKIFAVAQY